MTEFEVIILAPDLANEFPQEDTTTTQQLETHPNIEKLDAGDPLAIVLYGSVAILAALGFTLDRKE